MSSRRTRSRDKQMTMSVALGAPSYRIRTSALAAPRAVVVPFIRFITNARASIGPACALGSLVIDGTVASPSVRRKANGRRPYWIFSCNRDSCLAAMSVGETGSCRMRARWPFTRELTRSVVPSGKASASWCWCGFSGLSLQNCATLKGTLLDPNQRPRYLTFCSNANSVPGSRQTATSVSSALANPRVSFRENQSRLEFRLSCRAEMLWRAYCSRT